MISIHRLSHIEQAGNAAYATAGTGKAAQRQHMQSRNLIVGMFLMVFYSIEAIDGLKYKTADLEVPVTHIHARQMYSDNKYAQENPMTEQRVWLTSPWYN